METRTGWMSLNGVDCYYEVHGKGEPIIFLHHGFGCTRMWKDIFPPLVEKGYQVILYDRRGFGRSSKEGFPDFYVSDSYRDDSVEELHQLADALGLETFHLVGQCEGGVVGVDFAAAYPERVKTLMTSSTQCFSETTMEEFNASKFPRTFGELEADLREKMVKWHGEDYAATFYHQFCRYGGAYGREFFDLRPTLDRVTCPSLVLYPDRSFLFPVEQGVAFYRHLTRGELAVLPKCGHNTYEKQPEAYARHLIEFLARHGDNIEDDG